MVMLEHFLSFALRVWLMVGLWALIWWFVKPSTQFMRIIRAALIVVGFLGVLVVLKIAGQ
jgi:membrane-bound ClpP family serine protease